MVATSIPVLADGFIIVHEPVIIPTPPVWPGPRPPRPIPPRPVPPPRVHTFAPLEVVYHHVDVTVRDQVATTAVDQEFHNPNDQQLEGTYLFPMPKGAQIDRFSMEVNGRQVAAELLAADKARQLYEDIVRKHRDPALLEYVGRDLFKVRIFPIEPRSKKQVKLTYTQLLRADGGLVSYRYPLNTEKFSAKPIPSVRVKLDLETTRPLKSVYSPSHQVDLSRHGDRRATVGFEAREVKPDTDFQLFFAAEPGNLGLNLMTWPAPGEDGYFLLLASPGFEADAKHILPKDVVLVLDTSGSMAGRKLEQARNALRFCVENLNDHDRFDVVRFSTEPEALFRGVVDASRAHRDRALEFIRDLKPIGGTAIHEALQRALALLPAGVERPRTVIFLTDGLPTVGETDLDRIVADTARAARTGEGQTRVFCFGIGHDVNTHLLDRLTESTHATSEYVLPEEDLEVKVSRFFSKVKDPVLAGVKLEFPPTVRVNRLHPAPLPDLFQGEQLVLVGRYAGAGQGQLVLEGTVGGAGRRFEFPAQFTHDRTEHEFIPRLWATRRIGYLLDEIRLRGENAELRDEVVALARQHGIVTPYTAFLILEDEERRGVPLAQQSVPHLRADQARYRVARQAFTSAPAQSTGAGAVAAARYGLAQKSADQVDVALSAAGVEAERLLASAPAPTVAPPASLPAGTAGPLIVPTAPRPRLASPRTAPQQPVLVTRVEPTADAGSSAPSRFVGGRTFFQNGDQWLDARVQQAPQARQVRIQFNSAEYFDLVGKHPEVRPWLALGQNVQFVLGDAVYAIYE
jgi:Ca-activated chloride channel family protein